MTKLSELTDFQINKRVFNILNDFGWYKNRNVGIFDYCNNWSDAGPIIAEHRIGIIPAPENGKWRAAHRKTGDDSTPYHFTQHTNPLRAAMIVFLEMQ